MARLTWAKAAAISGRGAGAWAGGEGGGAGFGGGVGLFGEAADDVGAGFEAGVDEGAIVFGVVGLGGH